MIQRAFNVEGCKSKRREENICRNILKSQEKKELSGLRVDPALGKPWWYAGLSGSR